MGKAVKTIFSVFLVVGLGIIGALAYMKEDVLNFLLTL